MLPTEKASNIFIKDGVLKDAFRYRNKCEKGNGYKPQHLYLISDDEIKEGDWVYNVLDNIVCEHKGLLIPSDSIINYKKVIASTDPALHVRDNSIYVDGKTEEILMEFDAPELPESFIKTYVEAGGIDEVMVEYDTQNFLDKSNGLFEEKELINGLKLTDNNEVIISMLEENL